MTQVKTLMYTQAEVERMTGLSREVLRKWELRYGFPEPLRGARGQRQYRTQDVGKLALLSRLLKAGLRAGAIVSMPLEELEALRDANASQRGVPAVPEKRLIDAEVQALMRSLQQDLTTHALPRFFQACMVRHGLAVFVAHLMPAFNLEVGQAWVAGRLSVADEHRFTTQLRTAVSRALPDLDSGEAPPRVLLTTPPGELHSLGLLALHAQLRLQGADVIDLDCQTPAPDVLQAVQALKVGVVAISASVCMPQDALLHYINDLTHGLPPGCALWLGGGGCHALTLPPLLRCTLFSDTPSAVAQWQALSMAP